MSSKTQDIKAISEPAADFHLDVTDVTAALETRTSSNLHVISERDPLHGLVADTFERLQGENDSPTISASFASKQGGVVIRQLRDGDYLVAANNTEDGTVSLKDLASEPLVEVQYELHEISIDSDNGGLLNELFERHRKQYDTIRTTLTIKDEAGNIKTLPDTLISRDLTYDNNPLRIRLDLEGGAGADLSSQNLQVLRIEMPFCSVHDGVTGEESLATVTVYEKSASPLEDPGQYRGMVVEVYEANRKDVRDVAGYTARVVNVTDTGEGGAAVLHLRRHPDGAEIAIDSSEQAIYRVDLVDISKDTPPLLGDVAEAGMLFEEKKRSEERREYQQSHARAQFLASHFSRGIPVEVIFEQETKVPVKGQRGMTEITVSRRTVTGRFDGIGDILKYQADVLVPQQNLVLLHDDGQRTFIAIDALKRVTAQPISGDSKTLWEVDRKALAAKT